MARRLRETPMKQFLTTVFIFYCTVAGEIFAEAKTLSKSSSNPLTQLFPLAIIGFIFYFLMIRPQKKKLEEQKVLLSNLTKGDEIFTKSGLLGTITGITEKLITLEVSEGVKLKIIRSQIGGLSKNLFQESVPSKAKV